ncbi:MAG: HTTM domain-containing protein [Micrococcaceae bacterium]|nr:HTTM domain-containing protein [Micrococcaceae bacterium]
MSVSSDPAPSIRRWTAANKHWPKKLVGRIYDWFISSRHSSYGFAVMRIASGSFILGWLLFNLPIALKIWGPGAAYFAPYRDVLGYKWPLNILEGASTPFFMGWYIVAILLALAFVVGWRTRFITPLLFIFYTAINAQNTPISDGGNYFIRIMLIYLIFADLSKRWSLDNWFRQRKHGAAEKRETEFGTVLHNVALCVVVAQLCIVYFEAGVYKVQGALWENGTAVYYPLQSEAYGVFPWLSDLLTHNSWIVTLATYGTVIVQIASPFLLFHPITRRIALVSILGMHLGIAVIMGLPFFSGIMASADAVLVSSGTWLTIQAWLSGVWRSIWTRVRPKSKTTSEPSSASEDQAEAKVEQPSRT